MVKQRTTPVQVSNPYKFSVYRIGTYSFPTATWTKVALDGENFDTNNNFNPTTNEYTAPVSGFYYISAGVLNGTAGMSSSAFSEMAILVNGASVLKSPRQIGSGNTNQLNLLRVSGLIQMNAGDILTMQAYCSESRDLGGGKDTTFMNGFLVSVS